MLHSFRAHDLRSKLKFDIELEPGKRVYCFIGENGVGKTQLLENMGRALVLSNKKFLEGHSSENALYFEDNFWSTDLLFSEGIFANGLSINYKHDESGCFIQTGNFVCNLPLCFISAENRGYAKKINPKIELLADAKTQYLRALHTSLLEMKWPVSRAVYEENNKNIADWIATRTMINPETVSFDSKQVLAEVDLLFKILEPLMRRELSFFDADGKRLVRLEPGKLFVANTEIDKLPTGVISLMRIFQEIISCYGAWNGVADEAEKLDDISQTEGIVFIDEIEAHMHPKWQQTIISLLKKSFPKTTFYIATHSPTIVATTDEGEAYELKRDGEDVTADKLGNPRDWYLEDLFSAAFDVRLPQEQDDRETIEERILAFSKLSQQLMREEDAGKKNKLKSDIAEMYSELSEQFKDMPGEAQNDPRRDAVEEIWKYAQ